MASEKSLKVNDVKAVEELLAKLKDSGILNRDVTIDDLLKSPTIESDITIAWTAVYDSDKWGLILK